FETSDYQPSGHPHKSNTPDPSLWTEGSLRRRRLIRSRRAVRGRRRGHRAVLAMMAMMRRRHLVLADHAVMVGVEPIEHLVFGRGEFRLGDLAVMVGVHHPELRTMVAPMMRRHFIGRDLAVAVLVEALEQSGALGVELGLRDLAVLIGVDTRQDVLRHALAARRIGG